MVDSHSKQIGVLFDFDKVMNNKSLPWEKKCEEFLNLRQFHKKTLHLLVEFFKFCLEEE